MNFVIGLKTTSLQPFESSLLILQVLKQGILEQDGKLAF